MLEKKKPTISNAKAKQRRQVHRLNAPDNLPLLSFTSKEWMLKED
jgi:hypothetical protein